MILPLPEPHSTEEKGFPMVEGSVDWLVEQMRELVTDYPEEEIDLDAARTTVAQDRAIRIKRCEQGVRDLLTAQRCRMDFDVILSTMNQGVKHVDVIFTPLD